MRSGQTKYGRDIKCESDQKWSENNMDQNRCGYATLPPPGPKMYVQMNKDTCE